MFINRTMNDQERLRLNQRVAEVEKNTDVQVVLAVTDRCGVSLEDICPGGVRCGIITRFVEYDRDRLCLLLFDAHRRLCNVSGRC